MNERDQELHELIALAAVGALDAGERAALDATLAVRPDLRAELDELEAVAATLAEATAETPPVPLRATVLAAIADVPQLPADSIIAAPDRPSAKVVPLAARRRRWAPMVAAAAVLGLVAGGLVVRTLTTDDDPVDLAAVVDDAEAVTYPMEGTIATLRVVHSETNDAVALIGEGVPQPEGDQVYELWQITDGAPRRMEIFRPRDDGSVEVLVLDWEKADNAVFAVTVEPAGGSDVPTGEVVAATT